MSGYEEEEAWRRRLRGLTQWLTSSSLRTDLFSHFLVSAVQDSYYYGKIGINDMTTRSI